MAIYQNVYFDKLFDYYEHNGDKEYDLDEDGWSVDLSSEYHMKSEFEAMSVSYTHLTLPTTGSV